MSLLEVKNLHTYFKTKKGIVKAVNDVTYSLDAGKTLGIVGESGCGKSCLCHEHHQAAGRQRLDRQRLGHLQRPRHPQLHRERDVPHPRQRDLGHLPGADDQLNPVFTVERQIGEVLRIHQNMTKKQAAAKAVALLADVKIPNPERVAKQYPFQLSGGMRQRVMIAMALACKPKLLIADEPTTALDVTIQAQILKLMNDLKQQTGTSILFITHDLGVIHEMADEVAVMYCGQIVEKADAKEIFHESVYSHPYTEGLMISIPRLNTPKGKQLDAIPGAVPNPLYLPKGCKFAPRCKYCTQKCLEEEPPLSEVGPNHLVRCFYAEKAVRQQNAK